MSSSALFKQSFGLELPWGLWKIGSQLSGSTMFFICRAAISM